ncbi:YicC/YloC family endoribonuclease [Aestuariicoccus sp. MJ-SS9]|uniref:YicC/YloC family endoribonuclease n=1 Tax=Aestuariicoccus sp. MJ-SS9 TaxID=3079855 RepID=UPI0029113D68|nr:YicC/YloC family endoribonuclease [Aestuariicoccus sp. MJ-SS9]MDU8912102.1 YicC/YloC family endoribonuclease [Aestuariicoccus sp. MJ-SS9]
MRQSMTGYASGQGEFGLHRWSWDMRGVNGKGLELRFRVPDWIGGLEPRLKSVAQKALARGNVQLTLRVQGNDEEGALSLNEAQLAQVLSAMARIETDAMNAGLSLAPSTAAQIAGLRGVMDAGAAETDTEALTEALLADFQTLLTAFVAMRKSEGAALQALLTGQVDQIEQLVAEAAEAVEQRRDEQAEKLAAAMARVMDNAADADPQRIAQELALIAVKADVTEELDRLRAHIAAARDLLDQKGPVGRKLDFLMQEFNREANTLCSKAGSAVLTQIGLTLKTVIDQMREQVQNVE